MKNKFINIAKNVIDLEIDGLKKLKKFINPSFNDAVEAIARCQSKVILCGVGKSGLIAAKIAATLSSVGTPSFSLSASDCSHGDLGSISKKDILILISINISFFVILPRSPCEQSLADIENEGVPTDDKVDAIFEAISPLFPTPQKITLD